MNKQVQARLDCQSYLLLLKTSLVTDRKNQNIAAQHLRKMVE